MQKIEQSILYLLEDIGRLTKKEIEIKVGNITKKYFPMKKVILSSIFFRQGTCLECGRCCRIDTNLSYSKVPLQKLKKHFSIKVPVIVIKNSRKSVSSMYVFKKQEHCIFIKDNKCTIHKNKPLQCALHPIHIDVLRGNVYMKKRQYGRNYLFGCKLEFDKFNYKQLITHDIPLLKRLNETAKDLKISTFLPNIISYLEKHKKDYQKGIIPKDNIIIYSKKSN